MHHRHLEAAAFNFLAQQVTGIDVKRARNEAKVDSLFRKERHQVLRTYPLFSHRPFSGLVESYMRKACCGLPNRWWGYDRLRGASTRLRLIAKIYSSLRPFDALSRL